MSKICKILVVEDHEGIREVLGNALNHKGYDFTLLSSADDIATAIEISDHDIAIIDVPLAREDAFSLAKRAIEAGIGVILMTGHQRYFSAVKESGHPHILKPFQLEQLLPLVQRVIKDLEIQCVRRRAPRTPAARRQRR